MTTPPRQPTREMTNKNDSAPLSHVTPAEPPATDARSNDDEVICPNCIHQFRAVPVNVQDQLQRQAREIADWKRKYGDANEWGLRNAAAWKERAERAEAERDVWKDKAETRGREGCEARAERDALRECVRELVACADESDSLAAERLYGKPHTPEYKTRELDHRQRSIEAWKAARAKVRT